MRSRKLPIACVYVTRLFIKKNAHLQAKPKNAHALKRMRVQIDQLQSDKLKKHRMAKLTNNTNNLGITIIISFS